MMGFCSQLCQQEEQELILRQTDAFFLLLELLELFRSPYIVKLNQRYGADL